MDDQRRIDCPDCQVAMEPGCVPDHGHSIAFIPVWQRSESIRTVAAFFTWFVGTPARPIQLPRKSSTFPITSYRCPECGLIREYAFAPDDSTSSKAAP